MSTLARSIAIVLAWALMTVPAFAASDSERSASADSDSSDDTSDRISGDLRVGETDTYLVTPGANASWWPALVSPSGASMELTIRDPTGQERLQRPNGALNGGLVALPAGEWTIQVERLISVGSALVTDPKPDEAPYEVLLQEVTHAFGASLKKSGVTGASASWHLDPEGPGLLVWEIRSRPSPNSVYVLGAVKFDTGSFCGSGSTFYRTGAFVATQASGRVGDIGVGVGFGIQPDPRDLVILEQGYGFPSLINGTIGWGATDPVDVTIHHVWDNPDSSLAWGPEVIVKSARVIDYEGPGVQASVLGVHATLNRTLTDTVPPNSTVLVDAGSDFLSSNLMHEQEVTTPDGAVTLVSNGFKHWEGDFDPPADKVQPGDWDMRIRNAVAADGGDVSYVRATFPFAGCY